MRVALRAYQADDADAIAALANDRALWRNVRDRFPHPYAKADAEVFLGTVLAADPPTGRVVTVDGALAGAAGLEWYADVERFTAEIGYWLGAPFRGRGVGTQAIRQLAAWAFATHPSLERLEAKVFAWNPASARVLEHAGFRFEGRRRNAAFKDGEFVDDLLYGRLRADVVA